MDARKLILSTVVLSLLAGCSGGTDGSEETGRTIETLRFQFVPSVDPDTILAGTSGLGQMVIDGMAERGYTIGSVEITVSDSYEAAGEALSEGTVDAAWIPGATYAACSDRTEVILTATRSGLSNDSTDPWTWNGEANKTIKKTERCTTICDKMQSHPSADNFYRASKIFFCQHFCQKVKRNNCNYNCNGTQQKFVLFKKIHITSIFKQNFDTLWNKQKISLIHLNNVTFECINRTTQKV